MQRLSRLEPIWKINRSARGDAEPAQQRSRKAVQARAVGSDAVWNIRGFEMLQRALAKNALWTKHRERQWLLVRRAEGG